MTKYEQPYEIIGLKKNGNTLPVKLHSSIFSFESRPVRVLTVQPAHGRSQADMLAALQDANRELELKFKESTAELRTTNERLYQELNERRRKEAELLQRNRELTTLQAAAVAITSSLDLRFVLDTVVQEMVKLLEVESCTLSEWNQPAQTLTRLARYSLAGWADPTQLGVPLRLADYPLTDTVLEEQIPEQMTISQPHIDPNEAAYMQQTGLKSRLLIPMLFQRRVIGLAELADSRTERTFTHQEISQVRLLANQAANAIENARLYQQAQQEIVERKLAEAALEQERAMLTERVKERTAELSKANAELARASRLKDEFLASMSHELRTPLNAILGSAEILQAKIFGELTDKQQKYSHNIEESGRHLLALINDILDLSKIEAGKMDLEIRPISVKEVCEASIRLIKQLAHKKKLKLTHTIDETVVTILADERRLKQVLVNLLSNAIKFTPEEGQVGLEITGNPDRELVNFTVWDTGIGISREDMARLFQPFVQLDSSLARQYTGTGLGLSLVARMAEMHGGGVSLESEPGHGSRFTVSLPWPGAVAPTAHIDMPGETTQPEIAAAPAAAASPAQPPLILLAEDNEDTINTLTDYLQNQGYNLVIARNGKEAIERLHEDRPHLILMDVQMPGMDGLEATRRIRAEADPTLAGTPIIIITALAMPGDQERCLESGADDYLSKPLSLRGLVKTIEAHRTRP
jgi:signal transduction histidine kinase/ActR/RegA family two-component response regulator